jgi:hypothetical protein
LGFIKIIVVFSIITLLLSGCPSNGNGNGNGGNGYTPPPPPPPGPAEFEVRSLNLPSEPYAGEELTITVEVANVGESSGEYTASLNVDGQEVASQGVSIGSGQSQTISFSITIEQPGNRTVTMGDLSQTMEVLSPSWIADGIISATEYDRMVVLGNGIFELHWKSDGEYIYMAMKAETQGWVSVGFAPQPNNPVALDMILGYVEGNQTTIVDLFTVLHPNPAHGTDTELGGSNSISEFGGSESGGFTIIEFKRLLSTGDAYDQVLVSGTNNMCWAFGLNDDATSGHMRREYHQIEI